MTAIDRYRRLAASLAAPPARPLLAALFLAGLALRLVLAQASLEHMPVTSDEAMVVLQAKQIAGGDRPLLFMAQPYQFPLGAYLAAPLVDFLPRTAWAARGPSLGLGLVSFLGLFLLMVKLGPPSRLWPGLLIIAFPPGYLLLFQAAYPIPQYDFMLALWCLAAWLILFMEGRGRAAALGLAALAGLVGGLALSVHLLSLALIAPLALAVAWGGGWRRAPARLLAWAGGLALGLWPFILAQWVHPGAAAEVSGLRTLAEALRPDRLGALHHAMAGVLGAFSCLVPDFRQTVTVGDWLTALVPPGFLLLLLAAGLTGLRSLLGGKGREAGPGRQVSALQAALALAPWLGMALFLLNERANSTQYRYLLVLAWCLPFLLAQVCAAGGRWVRVAVGALAVGLAGLNLATSLALASAWSRPGLVQAEAAMPGLAPVMEYLRRHQITHCFAAHWTAYRITFLSDEKIVCAQPLNERFGDWPLPYKDQVSADPRAAYVLTAPDSFDRDGFEKSLRQAGIACRHDQAGAYTIYRDFSRAAEAGDRLVPPEAVTVTVGHNPGQAGRLSDGQLATRWDSGRGQERGMWLELSLEKPLPVNRLTLIYDNFHHDQADSLTVLARREGRWVALLTEAGADLDPCQFEGGLPLFGRQQQTLRLGPEPTDGLRLEIASPRPGRLWTLAEIRVFHQADSAQP